MPTFPEFAPLSVARPTREQRLMGSRRSNDVAVVSAERHQKDLRFLIDWHVRSAMATLVPEPQNADDLNAIAVVIEGRIVGYLPMEVARQYGPLLCARPKPMICVATLHGDDRDEPAIHVTLDFSPVYEVSHQLP